MLHFGQGQWREVGEGGGRGISGEGKRNNQIKSKESNPLIFFDFFD